MKRAFIALLASAALTSLAGAQDVQATLQVDVNQTTTGSTVRLVARAQVNGANMEDFRLPELDGFIVRRRSVQRPVTIQFGLGQRQAMSSSEVHTLWLEPQRPGAFEIGPAVAVVAGQEYPSNTVQIQVSGEALGAAVSPGADPTQVAPEGDGYTYDDRAFLRTVVSDTDPYVGQRTEVRVLLYLAERTGDIEMVQDVVAEGFWIEDLQTPGSQAPVQRQFIQGRSFSVHELRRLALYPLRAGELVIGAPQVSMRPSRGLASLFGGGGGGAPLRPQGQPVTVNARPLPEPVPARVVVGDATLDAALDRTQVRTGDAVTLTATVRGSGRLSELRLSLDERQGLRILEPQVQERPDGQRVFEWIIVAEEPGSYTLSGLGFSTFDPERAQYAEVRAQELRFEAAGNAIVTAPTAEPEEVEETPRRPTELSLESLRSESRLARSYALLSATAAFWASAASPPFLFLLMLGAARLRRRKPSEAKQQRSRRKQRLADAQDARKGGDSAAFYAAIDAALVEAIDARLELRAAGLTRNELREALIHHGLPADRADALLREREASDFARFSSAGGADHEMAECLERTRTLLNDLDGLEAKEIE